MSSEKNMIAVETIYQQTESGNASMFADMFHDKVRYVLSLKEWIAWNGKKWDRVGGELTVRGYVQGVGLKRFHEIKDKTNSTEQSVASRFWVNTVSANGIEHVVQIAKTIPKMKVSPGDLDKDIYLLNVQDGTIDMRTGKLKPHDPNDMITQIANVSFLPNKEHIPIPKWEKSLKDWHPRGGEDGTWDYLQELMGLCCTGDISSRCMPIFWGEGRNGKNAFLDTFLLMLGDYATVAPRTLISARAENQHPTEIASLWKKRLVLASEPKKGCTLRTDMIKSLTGDNLIRARFMYKEFFDFAPTHKMIMMTNHLPRVQETEDAIWDRLHKLPWLTRIPRERQIPDYANTYLREEWPGILRWAIQGFLRLQSRKPPMLMLTKLIEHETTDYRTEQNPARTFVESLFIVGAGLFTPSSTMNKLFSDWVGDYQFGENVATKHDLDCCLRDLGCVNKIRRTGNDVVRGWYNIGIRSDVQNTR